MFKNRGFRSAMREEGGDGDGDGGNEKLTAQVADLTKQLTSLQSKNDELLGETKKAKTAKRETEENAAKEAEEALKKGGKFEELFNSSQGKLDELNEKYNGMIKKNAADKVDNASLKLAGELAEGENISLLADFIGRRLRFDGDDLKVTDASGALTVSSIDDLKNEFKNDARYAALLKGNQSSGGGAGGGKNSGSAASKTMGRTEFDALSQTDRMKFSKSGGTITD